MSDAQSESWNDGSNYEPNRGPAEPTVPLPSDSGQQPQSDTPSPVPPPPMPVGGYAPPGSGLYPPAQTRDGQSVGALVTGILSLVFLVFCALLSVPLGIAAIVLGVQGRAKARLVGTSSGMATAGIVLGVVALALTVVWTLIAFAISVGS